MYSQSSPFRYCFHTIFGHISQSTALAAPWLAQLVVVTIPVRSFAVYLLYLILRLPKKTTATVTSSLR